MSLTKPAPPENHCEDPTTLLHTLDCEHIVKTPCSSSSPSPTTAISATPSTALKAPCSPSCTISIYTSKPQIPLSWLKQRDGVHVYPFICPVCIEDQICSQYMRYSEEHRRDKMSGKKVTDDLETNVQIWTYGAVLEAVERGGRVCEGFVGVFRIKYLEGFKSLGRGRKKDGGYGVWMLRDGAVDEDGGKEMEMEMQTVVRDQGAGEEGLVEVTDGDAVGVEGVELEDLADWLMDAKIGVDQDDMVDALMEGLSKL